MDRMRLTELCRSIRILLLGVPVFTLCGTLRAQDVPPNVADLYANVADAGIIFVIIH